MRLRERRGGPLRVLFFGMVRKYKGLDVLLDAVARVERVTLIIAGEFWESQEETVETIRRLGIEERVSIRNGYVSINDLADLFGSADVLALPYRGGSASFNVALAHRFGIPVVATDVGTFARDIRSGVDGYVVPREDPEAFADALRRLDAPDHYRAIRAAVPFGTSDDDWSTYLDTLEELIPATHRN
nr:glycosyltransferase family 4 protein [Chryseoglobus sp. 28M-23]